MGLNISNMLTPSRAPFYGIVLGNAATPLGSAVLPDSFGTKDNYHTEYIKFEMAVFESSYHAILGRPALAKFIAVPHYVYLLLKMPGKTGVLTFRGDLVRLRPRGDRVHRDITHARTFCGSFRGCAKAHRLRDGDLQPEA
jgi:hypothetical protein